MQSQFILVPAKIRKLLQLTSRFMNIHLVSLLLLNLNKCLPRGRTSSQVEKHKLSFVLI